MPSNGKRYRARTAGPRRAGDWTKEEDAILIKQCNDGLTKTEAARACASTTGRTVNACRARADALQLRFEVVRGSTKECREYGARRFRERRKCSRCYVAFYAPSPYRFLCDVCNEEIREYAGHGGTVEYCIGRVEGGFTQVHAADVVSGRRR